MFKRKKCNPDYKKISQKHLVTCR